MTDAQPIYDTLFGGDPDEVPTTEDINHEHFRTPHWVCDVGVRAMTWIPRDQSLRVLDAGAGNDARWGMAVKRDWPGSHLTAIEARPVSPAKGVDRWVHASLADSWGAAQYDVIVTNPPFSKALEWAIWCLDHRAPGGTVLMLMRNAFGHGWKRYSELHSQQPFSVEGKLVQRPVFEKGRSDAAQEYSCYFWVDGWDHPDPIIKWLSRVTLPPERQLSLIDDPC